MSISEKSKQELQELAKELGITGYKKLNKAELVAVIINSQNQNSQNQLESEPTYWSKYATHIYGLASIIGLIIAIFTFLPSKQPNANEDDSSRKESSSITSLAGVNSIAVLPFADMSPQKDQEYFGDGIAEEILNTLTKLTELQVSGRTSSFSFKEKGKTIKEIAQKLNVKYVLEGSVRKSSEKIRITAQLINASTGYHAWSETFDRPYDDLFKIQDELSEKIGSLILGELSPNQIDRITNNSNIDPKAFELFLEAKSIHDNQFYPKQLNKYFIDAEKKLKEAIKMEPNYALAYAGLADLYDTKRYILKDTMEMKFYEDLKIEMSNKALELNPNLPYVQLSHGWVCLNRQIRSIDYKCAYKSFSKAYKLDQRNTDGLVGLFWLYERFDLTEDCVVFMDKIIALNPNDALLYDYGANFYLDRAEFDKAIDNCKRGIEVDENFIALYRRLAVAYFFKNEMQLSLQAIDKVKQLSNEYYKTNKRLQIIEAAANDDIKLAEGINPNSWTLLYHTRDFEQLNSFLLEDLKSFKLRRKTFSKHARLRKHPYYKMLQDDPIFKNELEYHRINKDKALNEFPRAASFF